VNASPPGVKVEPATEAPGPFDVGVTVTPPTEPLGDGDGVGVGVGELVDGDGLGEGDEVLGEGDVVLGEGLGVSDGVFDGEGDGDGEGLGEGDGEGVGVGVGVGVFEGLGVLDGLGVPTAGARPAAAPEEARAAIVNTMTTTPITPSAAIRRTEPFDPITTHSYPDPLRSCKPAASLRCARAVTPRSRRCGDSIAVLVGRPALGQDRGVSMKVTLAFSLIGLGAIAAGAVGLRLPAGDRIAAGLALVVGAGVGVVTVAIGTQLVDDSPDSYESVFLTASALGFVATLASLVQLWRWSERERSGTIRRADPDNVGPSR
jgi:hypothetical protein